MSIAKLVIGGRRRGGRADRKPWSADEGQWRLERILYEEIDRLPHSYRAAVIVCYLEGMSQAQAARQLYLTESAVRGRLARARKLLGQRLTRRGVGPCDGLAALGNLAHVCGLPSESVTEFTVRSALCFVNRGLGTSGVVKATVHGIANGVLRTMWFSSLKTITATVLVVGLLTAGTSLVAEWSGQAPVEPERSRPEVKRETTAIPASLAQAERIKPGTRPPRRAQEAQPARENAELAQLAPGPIVRTIPVSKDCMVLSYLPDWNFGNVDNIGVGNNDGGVRTLIDWPAIPLTKLVRPTGGF